MRPSNILLALSFCAGVSGSCTEAGESGPDENASAAVRALLPDAPAQPYGLFKGDFSVGPNGTARYQINIEVPPGRAGMTPSLSLQYDSAAPSGLMGPGWRLAGLSRIARCQKSYAVDGQHRKIAFDGQDRFCLDGAALMEVAPSRPQTIEFRLEEDTRVRVIATPTTQNRALPAWDVASFEVDYPDGRIAIFGGTADSRVLGASPGKNRVWSISQIRDRFGNTIKYTYAKPTSAGLPALLGEEPEQVISSIDYGENTGAGGGAVLSARRSVSFNYGTAPLVDVGFARGGRVNGTQRLLQVRTLVNSAEVRQYNLAYAAANISPSSGRARLSGVQQCVGTICLPSITFEYESSTLSFSVKDLIWNPPGPLIEAFHPQFGDLNYDGRSDILYGTPDTSGWFVPYVQYSIGDASAPSFSAPTPIGGRFNKHFTGTILDLDGNGRSDVLLKVGDLQRSFYWLPDGGAAQLLPIPADEFNTAFLDSNGDGLQDFAHCRNGIYEIFLSTSPGIFSTTAIPISWLPCPDLSPPATLDIEGDGTVELLVYSYADQQVHAASLPNGQVVTRTIPAHLTPYDIHSELNPSEFADINGDGLVDILTSRNVYNYNPKSDYTVWLSTGQDMFGEPQGLPYLTQFSNHGYFPQFFDFNGDGKADVFESGVASEVPSIKLSLNPLASTADTRFFAPFLLAPTPYYFEPRFPDINGDGSPDVVFADQESHVVRTYFQTSRPADVLTVVHEGSSTSKSYEIRYASLGDPLKYSSMGCVSSYPSACIYSGVQIVGETYSDMGPGVPARHLSYSYRNLRRDLHGRGLLGFDQVVVEDVANHTRDTYDYDNTTRTAPSRYPNSGKVKKHKHETFLTVGSLPYVAEITENEFRAVSVGASFVSFVRSSTETFYEAASETDVIRGLSKPTRKVNTQAAVLDTLGYPTVLTQRIFDGPTYTRRIQYIHDQSNWFIGRPLREEITAQYAGRTQVRERSWTYRPTYGVAQTERTRAPADPLSLVTTFAFDAYGNPRLLSARSQTGETRSTTIAYSDAERMFPEAITNAGGHQTQVTYHATFGTPRRVVDPNSETTDYAYDGFGRLRQIIRPDDSTTTYSFGPITSTAQGLFRVDITPPGQPTQTVEFDRLGRAIRAVAVGFDGRAYNRLFAFDQLGRPFAEYEPFAVDSAPGAVVARSYLEDGRVQTETNRGQTSTRVYGLGLGTGSQMRGTSVQLFDPNGHWRKVYYSPAGWVEQTVDAIGGVTKFSYDPFGNLLETKDSAGNTISAVHDSYGLREQLVDPDSGAHTYQFNAFGEPFFEREATGVSTTVVYDRLGRPTTKTDSMGGVSKWVYDAPASAGGCATPTMPLSASTHSIGRMTCAKSPDGHFTEFEVDSFGRPSRARYNVDGEVMAFSTAYDAYGRVEVMSYPPGLAGQTFALRYVYSNGWLGQVQDKGTGFVYWGRTSVGPAGNTQDEFYGNGVSTHRDYFPTGDVAAIVSKNGSGNTIQSLAYDYDLAGNLISRRDLNQNMTERFWYDALDRLTDNCFASGTSPLAPPAAPTASVLAGAGYVAPTYPANLPNWGGPAQPGGSPPGRPSDTAQRTFWNSLSASPIATGAQDKVVWAGGGLLTETGLPVGSASFRTCTSYSYDALSNMVGRSDLGTLSYPAYVPGNYPATSPPRQAAHAASAVVPPAGPSIAMTYDAAGRTQSYGTTSFQYNPRGQLRQIARGTTPPTQFQYDAFGGRAKKTAPQMTSRYAGALFERQVFAAAVGVTPSFTLKTTESVYYVAALGRIVAEVRQHELPFKMTMASGSVPPWSSVGEMSAGLSRTAAGQVAAMNLANSRSIVYYHGDHQGTPESVTDAFGDIVERRSYTPFGSIRSPDWRAGTAAVSHTLRAVGYTGHEDDQDSGLVNMVGRVYMPQLGRFLTPDPFIQDPLHSPSLNRFAYVWNNPLTMTDPSGFAGERCEENTCVSWWREGENESSGSSPDWAFKDMALAAGAFGRGILESDEMASWKLHAASFVVGDAVSSYNTIRGLGQAYDAGGTQGVIDVLNPVAGMRRLAHVAKTAALGRDYKQLGSLAPIVAVMIVGVIMPEAEASELAALARLEQAASRNSIVGTLAARVRQVAGFADEGLPIILDENVMRTGLAQELRNAGYNVRDVVEIFGRHGVPDSEIIQVANAVGGRVLTNNVKDFGRRMAIPLPRTGGWTAEGLAQFISYYTK